MATGILLLIILLTIAIGFYITSDYNLVEPAVLFSLPLSVAVACGLLNYSAYHYSLSLVTVGVIGGGTLLFALSCLIVKKLWEKRIKKESDNKGILTLSAIKIPWVIQLAGIAFSIISVIIILKTIKQMVEPYGITGNYLSVISQYDALSKREVHLPLRGLAGNMLIACEAFSFVWGYLFLNNCFAKKYNWGLLVNFCISSMVPLATGGRGPSIELITAFVVMCLLMLHQTQPKQTTIAKKLLPVGIVIIIAFIGGLLFRPMLVIMGRTTIPASLFEYISLYLAAPIKNFDSYISGTLSVAPVIDNSVWGSQTFSSIYQSIAHWVGIEVVNKSLLVMPNQTIDGLFMGNVYTLFYTPLYDWGIVGLGIYLMVTGAVSQLVYEMAASTHFPILGSVKISTLLYGQIGYALIISFFVNKIAGGLVSSRMIRFALIWAVLSLFIQLINKNQVTNQVQQG